MSERPHTSSLARRLLTGATYETKTMIARSPRLALPLQRLRGHGEVVDDATEIVIESFPRCASTFTVAAFRLAQEPRPMTIAHHTHMTAQVLEGVRRGVPTLVLIRDPEQALVSHLIRSPGLPEPSAVRGFVRFYDPIEPVLPRVVVGTFEQVIGDLGSVIERLNDRFGTTFLPFDHAPEHVARIESEIEADARRRLPEAARERAISRPSTSRRAEVDAVRARLEALKDGRPWRRAQELYRTFVAAAGG